MLLLLKKKKYLKCDTPNSQVSICIYISVYPYRGVYKGVAIQMYGCGYIYLMYINVYPYLNIARVLPNESVRNVSAKKKNQRRSMMPSMFLAKIKKTT